MSEEKKERQPGQPAGEAKPETAAEQLAEAKEKARELTEAGEKAPGETVNPGASSEPVGMVAADSPPKPGGATPEQQEAASRKQNADPAAQTTSEPSDAPAAEVKEVDPEREAKLKAAAEARAARLAAKAAAEGGAAPAEAAAVDPEREAKLKAAAEARAARLAAKAAAEGGAPEPAAGAGGDDDKEAKRAEARAARAAARAGAKGDAPDVPKEPSPKQPLLDRFVQIIKENVNPGAVEEAYINERDGHLPTVVIKNDDWIATANVLKQHTELKLNYLRNVTGNDMETHMEVVYHLISLESKQDYCVKVKTSRDNSSVPSITPIWATGNWNEREIYDLLGIDFPGHPDLRRIMMSDDWVGHPLRKDYEPLDPEV